MRKAARDPELSDVLLAELDGNVLAESRTAPPRVYRNIAYTAMEHRNQLSLRMGVLKMQPPQHTAAGTGKIVLQEWARNAGCGVALGLKNLDKGTPGINDDLGLDDEHARESRFYDMHSWTTRRVQD